MTQLRITKCMLRSHTVAALNSTVELNCGDDEIKGEPTEGEKLSEVLNEELNIDKYISKPCETVNPRVEDTSGRVTAESENVSIAEEMTRLRKSKSGGRKKMRELRK